MSPNTYYYCTDCVLTVYCVDWLYEYAVQLASGRQPELEERGPARAFDARALASTSPIRWQPRSSHGTHRQWRRAAFCPR